MKKLFLSLLILLAFININNAQSITNSVTLAWDAVTTYTDGSLIGTNNIVKYNVYKATFANLSDLTKLNSSELTTLQFIDNALEINKTYYYIVRAYVLLGLESDNSDPVSLKTLKPGKTIIKLTTK